MVKSLGVWRLFLCAMHEEAAPIIDHYNLLQVNPSTIDMFPKIDKKMFGINFSKTCDKIPIYMSGSGMDVVLIVTGVGKVNASLSTSYALCFFNPMEIINIGMCGTLKPEIHKPGHIVLVRETFQHDSYIPVRGVQFEYLMDKIDLFLPIIKSVSRELMEFNEVVLATGDSFIDDKDLFNELSKISDVVDMEGYAIARVCQVYSLKLRMYKVISDSADKNAATDFKKSYVVYSETIKNLLHRI